MCLGAVIEHSAEDVVICVHVDKGRKNFRSVQADGAPLALDLRQTIGRGHYDERFDDLQEIEDNWEQIDAQIVDIHIEAVALVRAEAVGQSVVEELVHLAVLRYIVDENIQRRGYFQGRVEVTLAVAPPLNHVVNRVDRRSVQALRIIQGLRAAVKAFADAAHQTLVRSDIPLDQLIGLRGPSLCCCAPQERQRLRQLSADFLI